MVKRNRYGLPEKRDSAINADLDELRNQKGQQSHLEVSLKKSDINAANQAEGLIEEMNTTQMQRHQGTDISRDASTMQEAYGKRSKQISQLDLPTLKVESPKVSTFRRTQEKFT